MIDDESNLECFQNNYRNQLDEKAVLEIIPIPSGQPYSYEYNLKCEECNHEYPEGPTSFKTSFTCPECGSTMYKILFLKIYSPAPKYDSDNKYPPKK